MAWNNLSFVAGTVLPADHLTKMYDNIIALAAGDSGSPTFTNSTVEKALGLPATNGFVLASTTTGSRSWVNASGVNDWATKTTSYTAVTGDRLMFNTSGSALACTLPSSPVANNVVYVADYAGKFATNNLLIGRNGFNIMGLAENMTISTNNISIKLDFVDSSQGWRIV